MALQLVSYRRSLDAAFSRYVLIGNDAEAQADFARYLAVLVSGYVERTVYAVMLDFAAKRADKRTSRYVESKLNTFQNPSCEKIAALIGGFDPAWKDEFEKYVDGERKESLNSIVTTRNQVAHGESVGVTYVRLTKMRPSIYEVVDWIEKRFRG